MQVVSERGLPVSSIVWQSSSGAWAFTAVCKLTFALAPGLSRVADAQEPVSEEDNHWNDDESRSLVLPNDLAPFKPCADVVVVGHAFSPERRPVRSLTVRVCAGEIDKSVEVFADRWFEQDGRVREGAPFVKMPLHYERAAGGPDLWNPVGMSFDAAPDAHGRVPIANLAPPGATMRWRGDTFGPTGLGPIAPSWPTRMEKLYRHALRWSHHDWNARPLPQDIDAAYFNVAPRDQQTAPFQPDERLLLKNLHPEHARLVTSLPGFAPTAIVERASGHREEMELLADTMWIDADRGICTVTWRGLLGLTHAQEPGVVTMSVHGLDLRRRASAEPAPAASPPADAATTRVVGLEVDPGPALPFESSPWRTSPLAVAGTAKSPGSPPGRPVDTVFLLPGEQGAKDTLPFAQPAPGVHEPAPAPSLPAAFVAPPPLSFATFAPTPSSPPEISEGDGDAAELDRTESSPLEPIDDGEMQAAPAPPPMIGPLARRGTEAPAAEPLKTTAEPLKATAEPAAPLKVDVEPLPRPPAPPLEPEVELADYTVERCAKIAVAIACRPADTAKILDEHELSARGWDKVKSHWLEAIRKELARGKSALLRQYDSAYVAQVEAERGPIGVPEYARLAVAAERGTTGEAVAEMGLPSGAPIRIERVWMERMALDAGFGEKVRAAVDEQRSA